MRKVTVIALLLVVLGAAACFKEVAFRTVYVIKPLCQATSDVQNPSVVPDAVAYAFDADTAAWTVASYDDALAGIITSRSDPDEKIAAPYASSSPYGDEGWIRLSLDREWQMIVVVDPADKLYACTRQQIGENLGQLTVSAVFQPWKPGKSYKSGNWLFFNDFYVEPLRLDCFVDAKSQASDEAEPLPLESPKIYAYAADTAAWRIASYDDALAGIISSKSSDRTRTSPDFPAYGVPDSDLFSFEATASPLMAVVVDRADRIYAYTKAEIDLAGESPVFSLLFRPWTKQWIAEQAGWVFVDERHAPSPEGGNQTDSPDEKP